MKIQFVATPTPETSLSHFTRMEQEGNSTSVPNVEMRQMLSEFLAGVLKLEQLTELGNRLLISFQQALDFLRRSSINETSELVQTILKQNETKRVKLYVEAGCYNACDGAQSVTQMNTSFSELDDHLIKAKSILSELEILMDKAGELLQIVPGDENFNRQLTSDDTEITLREVESFDVSECASLMAVIYSMVKQDYLMQERVVSSLGLKSSSEQLSSYSTMWSLRPYVNDELIHDAINYVK